MNSESIVQQIQYSDVLRQVYARNLRALQYSPLWNQMSDKWFAAKHRFDTWSMPFARVCLTLDAVIQTAQSAHEERRNERIGKTGEQFLDLLSEETVVLIGMLADAGEENLQLVRKLDSEKTTSGSLAAEMQNFVMKLEVLFMNGAVLKSGYTAHVLELLERPRTLYINEVAKTLGGLPRARLASIVCSCLKRFAAWVQLTKDVVATEFHAFELLQTLSVLHFPEAQQARRARDLSSEIKTKLQKLSQVLNLDCEQLMVEYKDLQPLAQYKFDMNVESVFAWKCAVQVTGETQHKRVRDLHPQELKKL